MTSCTNQTCSTEAKDAAVAKAKPEKNQPKHQSLFNESTCVDSHPNNLLLIFG